ncbi:aminotransferase class I/II-fold pyridoxal phosphate-dependent enzyme [Cellulosilyticum ruminicola]|uniref:aminotransferase class I/II-fold pyridoxal phosphate-dependent enzyme n=1 Tax=Cellulosilyticum ruminicola TaxID=425254 RepID=UPI0006D14CC0|nr:PLP-dependent aminotransferase family protein [Cellulosilyticum ruminicola]
MNENLNDEYLDSMNFLNEISINYPQAISFASGRPKEELFEVETIVDGIKDYVKNNKSDTSSYKDFFNYLGQYNKTKGIINEEICQLVKNDEDIVVSSEEIILTDGAQEAMAIIINTIFSKKDEVLLVRDPSYVGLIGYAKIAGIPIEWIKSDKGQVDIEGLEETIKRIIKTGKRPRALYEVPDFHNPMGNYMSLDDRKSLIGLAEKYGFYIIEDNPYGYFRYEVDKIPTLKALDQNNHVLYIGSFAKSIFPSIRIGYLIVNKEMVEDCKKVKSFMTVNTSTLLQAMVGGLIRRENYSLEEFCQAKVQACKKVGIYY